MDTQQLRQRLGNTGAAREELVFALRHDRIAIGNWRSGGRPQSPSRDCEILEFADVEGVGLIRYDRKIIGACALSLVFVLLDFEARDLEYAVLFQCQANRFCKFQMSDFIGQGRGGTKEKRASDCRYPEECSASH